MKWRGKAGAESGRLARRGVVSADLALLSKDFRSFRVAGRAEKVFAEQGKPILEAGA